MKLNRKLELGIKAFVAMKSKTNLVRTEDLAVEIGESPIFLVQIMTGLKKSGIVTAIRGPHGGYRLVPNRRTTAFDVAVAVGMKFGEPDVTESASNSLKSALLNSYTNTVL